MTEQQSERPTDSSTSSSPCRQCLTLRIAYFTAWRMRETQRAVDLYERLSQHQKVHI
ncbi:hypothetical protein ACFP1Z_21460 [Streptomyces gamaensis]|uniref:Uncharacterized protein n=1 Tax=Streptomyces gamaensis TaxID=1763542 RepID=A0ABW0Z812_9ACTN